MEKEQVAIDETTETVVEQNARAYSKTVWNESTPITADKLNKIENGIADASRDAANCLPLTGGTLTGALKVSGNSKNIAVGTGESDVFINNSRSGKYLQLKDNGTLSYDDKKIYHEGNKPTAEAIGALPLSGGTLAGSIEVPGESRFYNGTYVDPWHGQACAIKASGHVGIGGSLKVNEKLAFSNIGTGGGLHANIHNLALHANTGNGQMMTADSNRIYVGNPQTPLTIESNVNPVINVGGNTHQLYHTGNLSVGNFVSGANGTGTTTLGNFNSAWKSGFYEGNGASNQPFNDWCWMIHAGHTSNNSGGAYNYGMQIAGQNSTNNFAMRTVNANGFGTWNILYHTGNKPTAGDIGALPLSGGTMNGAIYMESGGHTRRRIATIASHGGTDLGDNNSRTTVQSNKVPTWWNGSNNRAMLVFDTDNPSDYIVRCGAGLGGAAGYITFSW